MSIVRISKEADKKLGACVDCIITKISAVVGGEFSTAPPLALFVASFAKIRPIRQIRVLSILALVFSS